MAVVFLPSLVWDSVAYFLNQHRLAEAVALETRREGILSLLTPTSGKGHGHGLLRFRPHDCREGDPSFLESPFPSRRFTGVVPGLPFLGSDDL